MHTHKYANGAEFRLEGGRILVTKHGDSQFACVDADVKAVMSMDLHIRGCSDAAPTQKFVAHDLDAESLAAAAATAAAAPPVPTGSIMTQDRTRCLQGMGSEPASSK